MSFTNLSVVSVGGTRDQRRDHWNATLQTVRRQRYRRRHADRDAPRGRGADAGGPQARQ